MSSLALIILGALTAQSGAIVVHVGEATDVPLHRALQLASDLARTIHVRTGTRPVIDDGDWERCTGNPTCIAGIRARTRSDEVVVLRLFRGAQNFRVQAERFSLDPPSLRSSMDVPIDDSADVDWSSMSAELFPEPLPHAAVTIPQAPELAPHNPGPWIVLGTSAALLATGVAFGLGANGARQTLESELVTPDRRTSLEGRLTTQATTANILFGTAAVAAVGALIWWAVD